MYQLLRYLFYPNPGLAHYGDAYVQTIIGACVLLIVGSFVLSRWRSRQHNTLTRKLSRSWSSALLWAGLSGLFLIVSRVEQIQFFAMRFTWVLWGLAVLVYAFFQFRRYRARHYEVLPTPVVHDPRDAYLPHKKKR